MQKENTVELKILVTPIAPLKSNDVQENLESVIKSLFIESGYPKSKEEEINVELTKDAPIGAGIPPEAVEALIKFILDYGIDLVMFTITLASTLKERFGKSNVVEIRARGVKYTIPLDVDDDTLEDSIEDIVKKINKK